MLVFHVDISDSIGFERRYRFTNRLEANRVLQAARANGFDATLLEVHDLGSYRTEDYSAIDGRPTAVKATSR